MPRRYVVGKLRPVAPSAFPKGRYEGPRTFIDTDGTEYEIKPIPVVEWPEGSHAHGERPARLHLQNPKG